MESDKALLSDLMEKILPSQSTIINLFIGIPMEQMGCWCPVLNAVIAYSSHATTSNNTANAIQIDSLFQVNDMILEVVLVCGNHIKAAIISPSL